MPSTPQQRASVSQTRAILLLEDESAIRKLCERVLSDAGCSVISAPSPGSALTQMHSIDRPVDLLITDIIMPGMSGLDLAQTIAASHPDIRCLFISGYAHVVIAKCGVRIGSSRITQKPFPLGALLDAVRDELI